MSSIETVAEATIEPRAARRVHLLVRFAFGWALLILGRLIYLQVIQHDELQRQALQQHEVRVTVQPPRGAILDRNGQKLALSLPCESVFVNPMRLPDLGVAADIFSSVLHLDSADLVNKLRFAVAANHGFLWIKRKITDEEYARLRGMGLEWIEFRRESRRFYPNRELAAHVLGSVNIDGEGIEGVEHSRNDDLQGHAGEELVTRDVRLRAFERASTGDTPEPGKDIRLTIDSRMQYIAERELRQAVLDHHCKTGSLVAMDPRTGDILAMASYPAFDPNEPPAAGDDKASRFNNAFSVPFEPGSVFKVITLSAAIETTKLQPQTIIPCGNGTFTMFGRTIHESHGGYGALPMEDVLARSSNIGAIQIGLKVGKENLYKYVRRFGIGTKTGLQLPGESGGVIRVPEHWEATSIESISMGHEVSVTTLQLARACAVIATGGLLVQPRLMSDAPHVAPMRVLRPENAITMRQMMEGVVIKPYGTGHKHARIPGYTSAGKTGTAQIADQATGRYTHSYNASFMGFAPVTNPAIVVVATVNGATGLAGYGGTASAPVFREVAAAALRMLDVPKDLPDEIVASKPYEAPAAPAPAPVVMLPVSNQVKGPRVPDFSGLTTRAVVGMAAQLGLPVESSGSGLARSQTPAAGEMLPPGERIKVQFGR